LTAPQRLIDADDEFERDLIRSAHDDRPSRRALERMLLGLGVGFSKAPSPLSSSAPGAATSAKIGGSLLAKWLATGLAIGFAAIGGADAIGRLLERGGNPVAAAPKAFIQASPSIAGSVSGSSPSRPREGTSSTIPASSSAPVPGARPRLLASPILDAAGVPPQLASSAVASELIASAVPPGRPALGSFAVEAAPVPPSTLVQEMRLLDPARRALTSGDPRSALSALAGYERAFPSGALRPEASVLKVRALLAAGDRVGAEALGRRVIERAPQSEHASAVRAALGVRSNP